MPDGIILVTPNAKLGTGAGSKSSIGYCPEIEAGSWFAAGPWEKITEALTVRKKWLTITR